MSRAGIARTTAMLAVGLLAGTQIQAEGVCSAWAEPARVEAQVQLRKRHHMRADPQWVSEVARSPKAAFGYQGILMSSQERQEFDERLNLRREEETNRRDLIEQANAYADRHADQFAGMYLRRTSDDVLDPPVALVMMFTGSMAIHQAALKALPPVDIPLEILPARFSAKRLQAVVQTLQRRYANFSEANGVRLIGFALDELNNVVKIAAESNLRDAAARLEAGHGGTVKAVIYPLYDDSKWVPVTQGAGWRLLGQSEHRDGVHADERTRVATSESEWEALRAVTKLLAPSRGVDFSQEIALTFTNPLGCSRSRLDDIVIDTQLQSIAARFSYSGSPRIPCVGGPAGFDVFAVAIERAALPANPITLPDRPWPEDLRNPAYCPRGLVIPRT
jgi:hypothetical protein